jgi:hypothetical protein
MADDTKERMKSVLKLVKPVSGEKPSPSKKKEISTSISVSDSHGVVIGDNGTVNNITAEKVVHRPKVTVVPGHVVITEEQAVIIRSLVREIGDLEKALKTKPKSYAAIQNAANNKGGVTQYRLIPLEKFPVVEKYLRQWIGRLTGAKSAPKKLTTDWRKRQYAYIKTNVIKMGLEKKLDEYLNDRFQVDSISDLSDDDLRKTYLAVAGWKQGAK